MRAAVVTSAIGGAAVSWWQRPIALPTLTGAPRLDLPDVFPPRSARDIERRSGHLWGGWTVTKEVTVDRVAVISVVANERQHVRRIAEHVVEPYREAFTEVLIYFEPRPDAAGDAGTMRVQWTPATGFDSVDLP